MKAGLPLIAALAVALMPARAKAQAWVSNRDFSEGIGIRAGNLELHPSIGGEFGYDSNFFRSSEDEGVVDVLVLRVTPSLTLSTLGDLRRNATTPRDIDFSASVYGAYQEIFPLASEDSEASKQRDIGLGADARLNVFPRRKVGFDMLAAYARTLQTDGSSEDLAGEGFNRNTLRGGVGATWRPGGGLFEWRAGYTATYHSFEDDSFDYLANLHHEVGTRGRWRFLPRSALLFDSTYTFVRYANTTTQTDGDAVRARIGFHGLVTYKLALMGMVGWASSFYEPHAGSIAPRQFDSLVGNAEARWFIQPRPDLDSASITTGLSSIAVGYTRSFSNSYQGSFYQRDRGYLQLSTFLLGAVAGGLEFGISRVAFPETGAVAGVSQLRIDSRVFGEYRITDTFAVNATVQYDQVNSDPLAGEELAYRRWQAFVGARLFW
jgi:Putative beta-barrel porin 2